MGRNTEFSTGQVHGELVTPEELHTTVQGLLKSTHPVFGRRGTFDPHADDVGTHSLSSALRNPQNIRGWKGDSDETSWKPNPMNVLRNYAHPDIAANDCGAVSRLILPHMPTGSRVIRLEEYEESDDDPHHYTVEVPTTKGPHIVDFTHRQFGGLKGDDRWVDAHEIQFPTVQPKNHYLNSTTIGMGFYGNGLEEVGH